MKYGISVYLTHDFTLEQNIAYIKKARALGYDMVFTSMHLPEVNYSKIMDEFQAVASVTKDECMELISDISAHSMQTLQASYKHLKPFSDIGITTLRADYGFTKSELVTMSHNEDGLKLQINASTVTKDELEELEDLQADFEKITACHNFYPKPYTGLSYKTFLEKSQLMKEYGMPIYTFIPSQKGKRGPIYEGLPTLEMHRNLAASLAAKHLAATGIVDAIIFGDAYASEQELKEVSQVNQDIIDLTIKLFEDVSEEEKDIIFLPVHTNRIDSSDYLIRSEESRGYATIGSNIKVGNTTERYAYSVTIDNQGFNRYSGELQIILKDLPADERVNVIGKIPEDEHILVDEIKPGKKFRFNERTIV